MVRVPDLESAGDSKFNFCYDQQLDLFKVVPDLSAQLHLCIASWSASYQLGFLFSSFVAIKMDSVQSSSNTCKNYLLKIYSQHTNFLNTI